MKIIMIIGSLQSGGAERVLTTLANYWSIKGWEITIVTASTNKSFYELDEKVKRVCLDNYYKSKYSKLQVFYYIYGLRKTIISEKGDIVISFISLMNIFVLLATLGLKVPVLISERNYFDQLKKKGLLWLRQILYPRSDGMVILSQYDYDKYNRVKNKKIIFNPLNSQKLLNVRKEDKKNIAIAVGSLTPQKGFDMLVLALAKVDLGVWKFYIIGEGQERKNLEVLIKEYGLEEKVFLIGKKQNIFEYFKEASVFVLSSRFEGFPNVLAEAMAHGCASVAFNCKTGPSDMIEEGINGLLAKSNDVNDLSQKIQKIIDNNTLRDEFFIHSLKIRDKLEIEHIAASWEKYIETIINKK